MLYKDYVRTAQETLPNSVIRNRSFNILLGKTCCLFRESYKTNKIQCFHNVEFLMLNLVVYKVSGFGGLVVSRPIFRAKKSTACLPWGGSKAVSHVADLRGMSKNPGFTWKLKSQAKLTGHFSPVIPSFADRGLSCRLHVEAPRGESGNV